MMYKVIMRATKVAVFCLLVWLAAQSFAAATTQQTWIGEISDSACNKEHTAAEGEPVPPAPECVRICLRGGSKYVFVAGGENVYKIANQDHADLAKFAGKAVKLTGELKGDSVTITLIVEAPYNFRF